MENHSEQIHGGCTLWARQTIDSEIFTDKPDTWFKIWFYLVSRVNHQDNQNFKRGQAFVKYDWIMSATRASKNQVKHCIEYLKAHHMIATQKATRGMIITIINYDTYQTLDNYKSHTESQNKGTQKEHRSHAKNNKDKYSLTSNEVRLSNLLLCETRKRKPDFREPHIQSWAKHIDRMIRLDNRTPEKIEAVIQWCQQDPFWQNNILSTAKLREQFDQLELKMQGNSNGTSNLGSRDKTKHPYIR